MPIVFASAESTSAVTHYAFLEDVLLVDNGGRQCQTRYSFSGLKHLHPARQKHELVLVNGGKKLSSNFFRPYAICFTPDYVE
jgi:hypothetical protein